MIYLIITTSINNKIGVNNFEHRKKRYFDCINKILELLKNYSQIKPIIVENNGSMETYLNELNCDIVYTNNNKINCYHKGENELLDIKEVIDEYNINDEEYIIKLTGRYMPLNDNFINIIINNQHYDAFIKFYNVCTKSFNKNESVLGYFCLKSKYLKKFKYQCKESPEVEFAKFIRNNIEINKIYEIKNLDLECCFADDLRKLIV